MAGLRGTIAIDPDNVPEYIGPYIPEQQAIAREKRRAAQAQQDQEDSNQAAAQAIVDAEKSPEEEAFEIETAKLADTRLPEERLGRPIFFSAIYTPEIQNQIIDCIQRGGTVPLAAMAARIGKNTLSRWLLIGKQEFEAGVLDSQMSLLYQDIEYFSWEFIQNNLQIIRDAAEGGEWKASAWILDRWKAVSAGSQNERNSQRSQTTVALAGEINGANGVPQDEGSGMRGRIFATVIHQTSKSDPELDRLMDDEEDLDEA